MHRIQVNITTARCSFLVIIYYNRKQFANELNQDDHLYPFSISFCYRCSFQYYLRPRGSCYHRKFYIVA